MMSPVSKPATLALLAFASVLPLGWPPAWGQVPVSVDPPSVSLAQVDAEQGLELPLLEEKPKKKRKKKKKKKSIYPFTRTKLELNVEQGWEDNVFDSADYFVPETGVDLDPQNDSFTRTRFEYEWDHYLSRQDRLSFEYRYYGQFYDGFPEADRQRHVLELEWRRRLEKGKEITLGLRESRRLNNTLNRFGRKLDADLDYFRTDLFILYELDLDENRELEFEYRFVNWDYDETPGVDERSDDWREHRFYAQLERQIPGGFETTLWAEARLRDYTEERARDGNGDQMPGAGRRAHRELLGLEIEREFRGGAEIELEVEYDRLTDPYRDYYSYDGLNLRAELELPLTDRLRLEVEGKAYLRDHDKRRFLASRLPDPNRPGRNLDPSIEMYEDYRFGLELTYAYSENIEFGGGYRRRWYHVNDPTEEYQSDEFFVGLTYTRRKRTPPRGK